jgi:hypothetical protein
MRAGVGLGRAASAGTPNRFVANRASGTTVRPEALIVPDRRAGRFPAHAGGWWPRAYESAYRPYLPAMLLPLLVRREPANSGYGYAQDPFEPLEPGHHGSGWQDEPEEAQPAVSKLDWKPGGVFPADAAPPSRYAVPATPLETASSPDRPSLMAGIFTARLPGADAAASRLVEIYPVIAWVEPPCVEPDQERPGRKLPRVLGWLYRRARGVDLERGTASPPLLYLRSPLLAGFQEPGNCPAADAVELPPATTSCVAITASDGHEHVATYLVALPQLGSRTPTELGAALRDRLRGGEAVALRTLGGGAARLDPARTARLDVRACQSEMD